MIFSEGDPPPPARPGSVGARPAFSGPPPISGAARLRRALAGRYEIRREIGRGSTGTVYDAVQLEHGRRVAIKTFAPEVVASVGSERLLRAIRDAAALVHPHILPIYDCGEAEGLIFYAMPLLEGESLWQRLLYQGRLPVDDAVRIASAVASALAYAHASGVFHHNVTTANVLLASNGHVWISDFGPPSEPFAGGGPPSRTAPSPGAGPEADVQGDVYGLGCVLYEMLVGDPPRSVPGDAPFAPSPRAVRPEVPEALYEVVMRALAHAPAERFWSAAELAGALRRLPGQPPAAAPHRRSTLRATRAAALAAAVATVSVVALQGGRITRGGHEGAARSAVAPLAAAYREGAPRHVRSPLGSSGPSATGVRATPADAREGAEFPFGLLPPTLRPDAQGSAGAALPRAPRESGEPVDRVAAQRDRPAEQKMDRLLAPVRSLLSHALDPVR